MTGEPTTGPGTPRRETVTGPRRDVRRAPRRPVTGEIDAGTSVGETYLRALLRSQFRLGLATVAMVVLPLAALPLIFGLWPAAQQLIIGEVPLWWLLLGALVYPAILGVGWWYVRSAERNERQFTDLVGK
ncbi:MAG: hypothetical protein KDC23_13760 [Actinobacteria bacterium]|nr:hypothetical protein [Actinomycetota bacterium]